MTRSWFIADSAYCCPECWLTHDYECRGTCGIHLLQTPNVLVLVDDLFSYTPVKCDQVLIYCRQSLLLSWMLTFSWLYVSRDLWDPLQTVNVLFLVDDLFSYTPVKCDEVLIYCRQSLLLSWMLTFSWLWVSRDLWDPFIADNQCSCPCWWSSFIQNRDGYVQIIIEIHSHSMCLCNLSCPDFHEGLFLWWCVCVFVSRT